jgi:DNA-binding beta-propeller fold protein YncE
MKPHCLCLFVLLSAAVSCAQSSIQGEQVLITVADIPLPGPAVRFDYQTFDPSSRRLYIAHMNADQLVVFDTSKRQVVANLDGFRRVHGVTLAPEIHRLYASVTGNHQVAAVDTESLETVGTTGPINYPDGLAYAPKQNKVFVSDEHGGVDAVIDAATNQIINRILLTGIRNPHGISLDTVERKAFVAGEENHSLAMVDLKAMKVLSTYQAGEDPDVLAYDPGLKRLYVSAESGAVTIFQNNGERLTLLGTLEMPHAHTVSVDPKTHLVYFPLENVGGRPILRMMRPAH